MLKIVCVLKSGGDFDSSYVFALREGVGRHLSGTPHKFVCYTDVSFEGMSVRLLTEGLKGWFAKFEAFKEEGPSIYFDLDTVITGDFSSLVEEVMRGNGAFWMLEPFHPLRDWASGVMAWSGRWDWLIPRCKKYVGLYSMDQDCIAKALRDVGRPPRTIRRASHGIYSYKHHCLGGLPEDARIVCFHGKPRPRDVKEDWVGLP